jgi:hypothetical protein
MWYWHIHLLVNDTVPLFKEKPSGDDWTEFTEDLRDKYPNKTFYVETRTKRQLKEYCEMLKGAIDVI